MALGGSTLAGERAQLQAGVQGDHFGQDLQHFLGHSLVVDRDQVLGLGIDLQGLVEAQSSFNRVCSAVGTGIANGRMLKGGMGGPWKACLRKRVTAGDTYLRQ